MENNRSTFWLSNNDLKVEGTPGRTLRLFRFLWYLWRPITVRAQFARILGSEAQQSYGIALSFRA
jgi:hypothetical protein